MRRARILAAAAVAAAILALSVTGVAWTLNGRGRDASAAPDEGPAGETRSPAGPSQTAEPFPVLVARTPASVRQVVRYARSADAAAISELRQAARSEDPLVAGNALRALGRLGEIDGAGYLDDPRPRVRQEAIVSLGLSRRPEGVSALERALDRGEPAVRSLAIQALGRIGTSRALAVIEARVADPAATGVERAFAREAFAACSVR